MAVLQSVVVGRGKKSVGEITLAYQRGRTIARRRILENKSSSAAQGKQRKEFGEMQKLITPYRYYIDNAFQKSAYGSQMNNFVKTNYRALNSMYFRNSLADGWQAGERRFWSTMLNGNAGESLYFAYGDKTANVEVTVGGSVNSTIHGTSTGKPIAVDMNIELYTEQFDAWELTYITSLIKPGTSATESINVTKFDLYANGSQYPHLDIGGYQSEHININPSPTKLEFDANSSTLRASLTLAPIKSYIENSNWVGRQLIAVPVLSRYGVIVKMPECFAWDIEAKAER